MKKVVLLLALVALVLAGLQPSVSAAPNDQACWGQASAVFAQMGEMGEHSSSFPTPRLGLRNLARFLAETTNPDTGEPYIPDDSMQALGAFVAAELGLEIDACM